MRQMVIREASKGSVARGWGAGSTALHLALCWTWVGMGGSGCSSAQRPMDDAVDTGAMDDASQDTDSPDATEADEPADTADDTTDATPPAPVAVEPPAEALLGESCVGIDDPDFDLDVERDRVDPPFRDPDLPALFIVGDSTVRNRNVQQVGWGDLVGSCFDQSELQVANWAREGRSARSFIEESLWRVILLQLQAGDYVLVQFAHNDQSPVTTRGSLPGVGDETQLVVNADTGLEGEVRTYGSYLRQYAEDVAAAGAQLVFVTPVPRNYWLSETETDNSVMAQYVEWMQQVAEEEGVPVIDLNGALIDRYTELGRATVRFFFTSGDDTHTNLVGASWAASFATQGLQDLDLDINQWLEGAP